MKNNSTPNQSTRLSRVLAGLSMLAACVSLAFANPGSPTVVNGQATFNQTGNVLTITNTPNTIINWQNFNIGAGEITRFLQQNSDSAVLNRILGQNPSQILGALQSNGRVFLINPNGIVFGQGAQVNVNGLVASSLNLPDQDFLSGKRHFVGSPGNGKVSNQGNITTPGGGSVFLLAPSVENSGIINAPNGDVLLAAGHSIKLVDSSNPEVQVVVSAPQALAVNLGQLVSQGGRIGIYGALVKQGGRVNADSAVLGENGKIMLKASGDTLLDNGSVTSANSVGRGGDISVLGERVAMLGNASIQANGQTGGGTVLVGGDYQGKNAKVQNAERTIFDKDASISADALQNGDGGKVIVWANDRTNALGIITARGGNQGGNGGLVETSGKNTLDFHAKVNVSAPKGKIGTLLLDPANITIIGGTGDGNNDSSTTTFHGGTNPAGTVLFADPDLTTASVSNIYQSEIEGLAPGTNIVLEATNSIKANGTFTGNVLTLPINSNLTMRTSNETTGATPGIDLAHTAHGVHFDVIGRGIGSITLETGTSMMMNPAPIQIGKLQVDTGNVNVLARDLFDIGSSICTNSGDLNLVGHNITLASGGQLFSHTGSVNLNATTASGTITLGSGSTTTIDGNSTGKMIRLTADNLDIAGTVNSGPLGEVRISPNDLSRNIDVVTAKSQTSLELTQSDLANVSGGFLSLHNNAFVHVNSGLDLSGVKNFSFFANNIDIQNIVGLSQANSVLNVFATNQIGVSGSGGLSTNGSNSKIFLVGEAINLAGSPGSINAGAGTVYLGPDYNRTGTDIEVGLNATSVPHVLGISTASLSTIQTSGKVQIGTPELGWAGNTTVLAGGLDLSSSSISGKVKLVGGHSTGSVTLNGVVRVPNGLELESEKAVIINSGAGIEANGISLVSNEMHLDGGAGSIKGSASAINVLPATNIDINLGTASDSIPSTLGLSASELASFNGTGVLRIGDVNKSNNLTVSADIAPTFAGVLSLQAGGSISQNMGTITTTNLALKAVQGVQLNEANHVFSLAGMVGDGSHQDRNFSFNNAQNLSVSNNLDGLNGIMIQSGPGNFDPQNPGSVISLISTGNLSQTGTGLLTSKALYAEGANVVLNQPNPVGVIAGKWTGNTNGDVFKYASTNGIALSNVNSHSGITYTGTATPGGIDLTAGPGGIQQNVGASVNSGGALVMATTGPVNFPDANNNVSALSSQGSGAFFFKNSTDLQIGVGQLGITSANQAIGIDVTGGKLTLAKDVNAGTGQVQLSGQNLDVLAGVGVVGDNIHLRATNASGKIATLGGTSSIGTSASTNVLMEADVIDFHAAAPNITASPGTGVIGFVNHSDDVPIDINANLGGNFNSHVIAFGNASTGASNTTSAITVSTPINAPNSILGFFTNGSLTQTAPIVAQGLGVRASSAVLNSANQVHLIAADIKGAANPYSLTNTGALTITDFSGAPGSLVGITTVNGPITINNTGAVVINNPVNSGSGAISIVAHSPLTVNSSVTTTGGNILLEAGSTGSTSDVLLISSTGSVGAATGLVTLRAGSSIIEPDPTTVQGSVVRQPNLNPVLLPTLNQCIANPALHDCNLVLPPLSSCITNPTAQGCSVVLPNLTTCIATPTLPGCSVVLPNITACIATPTLPGCSVTLPNLTACIATPTLPGCSVVLPNITACIATPTLPGCSVTLPNLTACIATPTLPGCSVVLPNITACIATPTLPGCSVTLPNLTACIATPTLPGCQVVLPNITACIATPTLPGCSVTLPNLRACIATPTLPGCSVVLPTITACIAEPTLPGCSVSLPNIAACIATPTLPGCQVVLPNITACIATPTLPGCSITLPNLTACIATPTLPGCSVVLPNITACIATPTLPGCSVTLPNLSACIATPSLPGCQAVLPNLTACIATPTLPGCSVTLPNLTACIATPSLPGCQVVLPNLTACIATPTLPGCTAVLPSLAQCTSNASLSGCAIILPPTQQTTEKPLQEALNASVKEINGSAAKTQSVSPSPVKTVQPGTAAEPTTLAQLDNKAADKPQDAKAPDSSKTDAKPGDKTADDAKKDEKKDDKKDDKLVAAKDAPKKEEPARKLYCN